MLGADPAYPVAPAKDYSRKFKLAAYLSLPALFIGSVVAAIPLVLLAVLRGNDPTDISIMAALLLTVVAELGVIGAALAFTGQLRSPREVLGLKNFSLKTVAMGAGLGAFFLVGLQAIAIAMASAGNKVESSDTSVALGSAEGLSKYLVLLVLVPLVVPLVEELYFRGYVLGFLLRGHKLEAEALKHKLVLGAIFFSAVVFSLAHFQGMSSLTDVFILVWIFFFALVLGAVRVKTGSIYPTYAAHLVYNGLTSLLLVLSM